MLGEFGSHTTNGKLQNRTHDADKRPLKLRLQCAAWQTVLTLAKLPLP